MQVVREPHPPSGALAYFGSNESSVHPMPSHAGRGQIAPIGRWRQRKNAFRHVSRGRREGSEEEGCRDRGRLGSIGGCWDDRRPRIVIVDSLSSEGKALSTRTANRCAVEPVGVFCQEGEEAFDCPRGSSPATRSDLARELQGGAVERQRGAANIVSFAGSQRIHSSPCPPRGDDAAHDWTQDHQSDIQVVHMSSEDLMKLLE